MSVVSVRVRSFILALFIRDDGERFLLGDDGYDFIDSQLHFSANTIENDEVEKQGADGTMLAGQVRRASVQTFGGYVGDATTPKEEIEQMRREFITFFAKNHHFRVIYVDCNRNAWQRKGGYLVDAPEVKELWQIHPEYHVGLNFEDVNYYEYDENAEGQEILANIMKVPISSAVEGGLVWDEDGAVSEDATVVYDGDTATASGTSITVSDAVEAPFSQFDLKGNTSQQTYSGKNLCNYTDAAYPVSKNGLVATLNSDGSITVTGTPNANYVIFVSQNMIDILEDGATYTISSDSYSADFYIDVVATRVGGGNSYPANTRSGSASFTVNKSTFSGYTINIQTFTTASWGASSKTITRRFQLEKSSSASSFEPYVGGIPAPNPDYPQAVKTVTGENVVKISDGQGNEQNYEVNLTGKNLFDGSIYRENYVIASNGSETQATGGVITTAVRVEPNTTYTASVNWDATSPDKYMRVGIYTSDMTFISRPSSTAEGAPVTFTTPANARYVRLSYFVPATEAQLELGSQATSYAAYFEPIELCKIGDYQDYIYKSEDKWYVHKEVGKITSYAGESIITDYISTTGSLTTGATVYYALASPTDTEITNEALVAQLEAILSQGKTYAGTNNITTVIAAGNERGELEIGYYTSCDSTITAGGYVWEEGGSGGPTVIVNESISAVSPVWTVYGPALNPQLENATNGDVIEYVGLITEGQTLVIDMGEQTAKLDGLNVISNVTGDFISLESGANTLLYSAGNDAPESEIGWSEIVG